MAELGKAALFAGFDTTITTNGNNEITGSILNAELKNLGDSYPNKLDEDHYFLREYNASRSYSTGFVCMETGVIYKANKATSGVFVPADWDAQSTATILFTALTDTPGSYAGQAGKILVVNGGETGIEFAAQTDLNGIYSGNGSLTGATTVTLASNDLIFDFGGVTSTATFSHANDWLQMSSASNTVNLFAHSGVMLEGFVGATKQTQLGYGQLILNNSGATTVHNLNVSTHSYLQLNNVNLGIGTVSPTAKLQIKGTGATSGTESVRVTNSADTFLFKIQNDGITTMAGLTVAVNGATTPTVTGAQTILQSDAGGAASALSAVSSTNTLLFKVLGTGVIQIPSTGLLSIGGAPDAGRVNIKSIGVGTGLAIVTTNSSNVPLFHVRDNGKIGIGTAAPTHDLHIEKSINGFLRLFMKNASNGVSASALLTVQNDNSASGHLEVRSSAHSDANVRDIFVIETDNNTAGMYSVNRKVAGAPFKWLQLNGTLNYTDANTDMVLDESGNLALGATTFGTNATRTFSILAGTAPTSNVTDVVQIYTTTGLDLNVRDEAGTITNLLEAGHNGWTFADAGAYGTIKHADAADAQISFGEFATDAVAMTSKADFTESWVWATPFANHLGFRDYNGLGSTGGSAVIASNNNLTFWASNNLGAAANPPMEITSDLITFRQIIRSESTINVNGISERTIGDGVTIENVLLKDGSIGASGTDIGFYGTSGISQPVVISDPAGGATIDAEARTAINALIDMFSDAAGGNGLMA